MLWLHLNVPDFFLTNLYGRHAQLSYNCLKWKSFLEVNVLTKHWMLQKIGENLETTQVRRKTVEEWHIR